MPGIGEKAKTAWNNWKGYIILGGAVVVALAVLLVIFSSKLLEVLNIKGSHGQSILFSSFFGTTALIMLFIGSIIFGVSAPADDTAPAPWRVCRNFLVTMLGAIAGWAVAVLYTPFGDADAARLHSLSQAVTVFASGYLISKFDRFLEQSLFGANNAPKYAWVPLGLAVCAFAATTIMTFEARQYASDPDALAIRFAAATNAQFEAGEVKLVVDKDNKLSVAGKDYGPVSPGSLIKYVPATQNVYVNGEPVEQVPTVNPPAKTAPPPGGPSATGTSSITRSKLPPPSRPPGSPG